jgi:hypothetical protein
MATFNKFYSFVEALAEKKHDLGSDTLTVALCNAANAPSVSADAVLADITTIAYTNLSTRVITRTSSEQTTGTYKLVMVDLTLTASGGSVAPFRYIIVYNETAANDELIGYYDYGSDLTLADGESLTLDFSATNGLLQLT